MQKLFDIPTVKDELLREILIELRGRNKPAGEVGRLVQIAEDKEKRELDIVFFTYPNTGDTVTLAAGSTILDFAVGTIKDTSGTVINMQSTGTYAMRHSLRSEHKDFLRSIYINSDKAIKVKLDNADVINVGEEKDLQATFLQFQKVEITCTEDTEVFVLCCTNPEAILTLVDKASQVSGGRRLVRGEVVVETAAKAGSILILSEVLGTDDPTRNLTLYPAVTQKFRLNSVKYHIKNSAARTYQLYLLQNNDDPGAGSLPVEQQSLDVVYDSGSGMVDDTTYVEINGGVLPMEVNLSDTGKLYYMLTWSGAPGDTYGYISIRGEAMA